MNNPSFWSRGYPTLVLSWILFGFTPLIFGQSGVPRPDHVVIVVEENHGFQRIFGVPEAPYINRLAQQGALFISSFALTHPSQPNYLALFSGSGQGVSDDSCPHSFGSPNLASALLAAGYTFSGYSESLPAVGSGTCDSGPYARKHNPWVNFSNVPRNLNLPFSSFPTNYSDLPDVCFVIPNLNNDMHDGTVDQGDAWLRQHFDGYWQWANAHNSLLILTQDEGHNPGNNQVITIFLGPMVRPGQYCEYINHYTLLRTLLAMYDLAPIGRSASIDPITSCWTPESAASPLTLTLSSPVDGATFTAPTNIELNVEATSSDSMVRKVEFFRAAQKLGEATNNPFDLVLTDPAPGTYCLVAKATDALGRTKTSTSVRVQVLPGDMLPPSVAITLPLPNARLTNAVVRIQGTAGDDVGVERVELQVGGSPVEIASGTTNWSAQIDLEPGTNVVSVKSVDLSGRISAPVLLKLIYVVTGTLDVEVGDGGTVVPNLAGQSLIIGRAFTMTAMPTTGYLFLGWSGGVTSTLSRLTFEMRSNLMVRASFVPNPFSPAKGSYYGLFYEAEQVQPESSGFVKLSLTDRGAFTGNLLMGGRRIPVSGQFDWTGQATTSVARRGTNALSLDLSLDLQGGARHMEGHVTDGHWVARVLADRPVFNALTNPALFAGQYTLDIPGNADATAAPAGDGFGVVHVGGDGMVRLTGALADGTRITQAVPVSRERYWPFYVSLYGGKGLVLGWLNFTNLPPDHLGGPVNWIRPVMPGSRFYPLGFTQPSLAVGSKYRPPAAGERVLSVTDGQIEFSGGDLTVPFTNAVSLGTDNKLSNLSTNRLVSTISLSTGLWRGNVTDPATGRSLGFQGVLLPDQGVGVGFFLGAEQGGRVLLHGP